MRSGVLKMRSCVLEKKKDAELCAEKCNATPECVGISIAVLLGHCWLKVAPFYYYCPRAVAQGCRFLLLLSPLPCLLLLLSPLKLPCLLDFHPRVPEQLLAQGCPFFSCFFSPVFFLCALASFARACLLSKET